MTFCNWLVQMTPPPRFRGFLEDQFRRKNLSFCVDFQEIEHVFFHTLTGFWEKSKKSKMKNRKILSAKILRVAGGFEPFRNTSVL